MPAILKALLLLCLTERTAPGMTALKPYLCPKLLLQRGGRTPRVKPEGRIGRGPRKARPTGQTRGQRSKTSLTLVCSSLTWWLWRSAQNPIPFRTRPLNASAPMVLCLKARESRSPPGLVRANKIPSLNTETQKPRIKRGFLRSRPPFDPHRASQESGASCVESTNQSEPKDPKFVGCGRALSRPIVLGSPSGLAERGQFGFQPEQAPRRTRFLPRSPPRRHINA